MPFQAISACGLSASIAVYGTTGLQWQCNVVYAGLCSLFSDRYPLNSVLQAEKRSATLHDVQQIDFCSRSMGFCSACEFSRQTTSIKFAQNTPP